MPRGQISALRAASEPPNSIPFRDDEFVHVDVPARPEDRIVRTGENFHQEYAVSSQ